MSGPALSTRATVTIVLILVAVAFVSYLGGQGSLRRRQAFIVGPDTRQYDAAAGVSQENLVAYVEKRLQEHSAAIKQAIGDGGTDGKKAEDYIFRPHSRLNNELDQKSIQNSIHSNQLANDLLLNKAVLDSLPETIDQWLGSVLPSLDWRAAGFPLKHGFPAITNGSKCEEWIDDILSQRTDMQKADRVEPQNMPPYVCDYFRKLQATKVCRPGGSRSWIFHALGKPDVYMVRHYLDTLRGLLNQHNYNGMVYFTFVEMLVDRNPAHWIFPERTWIIDATITAAKSFKQVYGVWPLVVANTERERELLLREGVPCFVDNTLIWRGAQVAGYRWLSRTTIVKYIYAYLILEAGFTAVFFDSDSFWARKLILPANGPQTYDFIINEEAHTRHPDGKYYRMDPMKEPKAHGYRPVFQAHGYLAGLAQTTCNGFSDTVLYNSGIWVAYPTEWTMRFLSTFIDNQLVTWSFWWEQNLFQHLIPIFTAWGMRVGVFGPGVSGWGEPRYNTKEDCVGGHRGVFSWVHTKECVASWKTCGQPGVYTWKAPSDWLDAHDANMTMHLIADSQK